MSQIQLKWPYFLSSIYNKGHKARVCGLKVSRNVKSRLTLEDMVRCFYQLMSVFLFLDKLLVSVFHEINRYDLTIFIVLFKGLS